jgi:hypothetical protein
MAYTTINKSTAHFNTKLYTGTGSENAITGVGFQPDLTWIKNRDTTDWHRLQDAVRGATKELYSNANDDESTLAQSLKSFNTDGFTLGTLGEVNTSSENYASWNWKAGGGQGSSNTDGSINTTYTSVNTTAGFSISTYTGNGTAGATVGHGLGVVPSMIIVKIRSGDHNNWGVYHKNMGATKAMYLDQNSAETTDGWMNNTAPTNQVFSLSGGNYGNVNTYSYVAYCFAEKTGYSKFGTYTGNGNSDGTFVYTGFKPAFVIYKGAVGANAADNWEMADNKRSSYNPITNVLYPNLSNAEGTGVTTRMDMLSNGFKMRTNGSDYNGSGQKYIYMAFGQSLVGSNNVPCTAR